MESEDVSQLRDSDNGSHGDEADKLGIEDGELGIPNEGDAETEEGQLISNTVEINSNDDSLVEEGQLTSDMITDENVAGIELKKGVDTPSENGCVIERESPKSCPQSESGCILILYEIYE